MLSRPDANLCIGGQDLRDTGKGNCVVKLIRTKGIGWRVQSQECPSSATTNLANETPVRRPNDESQGKRRQMGSLTLFVLSSDSDEDEENAGTPVRRHEYQTHLVSPGSMGIVSDHVSQEQEEIRRKRMQEEQSAAFCRLLMQSNNMQSHTSVPLTDQQERPQKETASVESDDHSDAGEQICGEADQMEMDDMKVIRTPDAGAQSEVGPGQEKGSEDGESDSKYKEVVSLSPDGRFLVVTIVE